MGGSDTRLGTKAPLSSRMPVSIAYFLQRSAWWHFDRLTQDLQRQPPPTGGEGLWKQVFTCWAHFSLWQKVPPMFRPDTFHSHLKCNLNI